VDPGVELAASFGAERAWELLRYLWLRRRAGATVTTFQEVVDAVRERHPGLISNPEAARLEHWLRTADFDDLLALSNGPVAPVENALCTEVFESHVPAPDVDLTARLAADRVRASVLVAALWESLLRTGSQGLAGLLWSEAKRTDAFNSMFEFLHRLADDHVELLNEGLVDRERLAELADAASQLAERLGAGLHLLPPTVPLRAPQYAAPSRLLRPRHAIVPFFHRREELDALQGWAGAPPPVLIGAVTGPAGCGKTRLGAEFCAHLGHDPSAGWQAGFLDVDLISTDEKAWFGSLPTSPTCVVVDYAEAHAGIVRRLARRAALRGSRLRVLMLERHPTSPQDPFARLRYESDEVDEILDAWPKLHLTPGAFNEAQRLPYLREAMDALGRALGVIPPAPASVDRLATPLELSVAALGSVLGAGDRPTGETDLLASVMKHEERYWLATAAAAGIRDDVAVLRQCVAVAALVADGVASEDELADYLREVESLQDAAMSERRRIARWLRRTYPGEGGQYVARLEPDLLAEYLVAAVAL
jgi:hypothetical protein